MTDELLTPHEAAAFLKKSLRAFYAWRRRHQIPSVGIGRSLRFRREDLIITPPPYQPERPTAGATSAQWRAAAQAHARGARWRH